jgi:SNF2 family DNA or RNA helicase
MLVIDESDLVKNFYAMRTKRMERIAEKCIYRVILNGTPTTKSETDLFAQWYLLDKRVLGYNSFYSFAANHIEYDKYGKPRRCLNVDYLTAKIAPYSYQIKKDECFDLPKIVYERSPFHLTHEQSAHYEDVMNDLLDMVDEFDETTIYRLFTGLQLVCSGRLVYKTKKIKSRPFFDDPEDNPRVLKLLGLLPKYDGDKVIIWCKYRHEMEDIREVLLRRYPEREIVDFHGGVPVGKRQDQIERFRGVGRFMIANKRCGGYGFNLQFCHRMIYYSNDFNWGTRSQSEARVHRLGQEHEVKIDDIYASAKIDVRILDNLARKDNLSKSFKSALKSRAGLADWLDGKDLVGYDQDWVVSEGKARGA